MLSKHREKALDYMSFRPRVTPMYLCHRIISVGFSGDCKTSRFKVRDSHFKAFSYNSIIGEWYKFKDNTGPRRT